MSQIFWCFSICLCCFCFHFPWFHDVCSIVFLNNCLASFLHLKFKFDLYNSGATKTNNPWKRNEKETRCLQSGMVEGCVWRNSGQTDACDVGTSIGSSNYAATRKICNFFSLPSFKTNTWHWKISHETNRKLHRLKWLEFSSWSPCRLQLVAMSSRKIAFSARPWMKRDQILLEIWMSTSLGWMDGWMEPSSLCGFPWMIGTPIFLVGIMGWSILDRFRL